MYWGRCMSGNFYHDHKQFVKSLTAQMLVLMHQGLSCSAQYLQQCLQCLKEAVEMETTTSPAKANICSYAQYETFHLMHLIGQCIVFLPVFLCKICSKQDTNNIL